MLQKPECNDKASRKGSKQSKSSRFGFNSVCDGNGDAPRAALSDIDVEANSRKPSKLSRVSRASKGFQGVRSAILKVAEANKAPNLSVSEVDLEAVGPDINGKISILTRKTLGLTVGSFLSGFMMGILMGTGYGFYLGYLGLDSYVLAAIGSISKLPEIFLLPFGCLSDSVPIWGCRRKSYLVIGWSITAVAIAVMGFHDLPAPYYCQAPDGSYDYTLPPCNPAAHDEKHFYVVPGFFLSLGLCLVGVAGEGLIIEYSQLEAWECRGQLKAELTMVGTAGGLLATLFIGCFMNSKAYLGTFDWGLQFNQIMYIALALVLIQIPLTMFLVWEPPLKQRPSFRQHLWSSWDLVQSKAFVGVIMFAFGTHMMVTVATTAGPLVRSQWAEVKVLQQQLCGMLSTFALLVSVWFIKVYFLQASWRKIFYIACVASVVLDAVPVYLTVFNVVRNQYFFLGEEILSALPMAAIKLVSALLLIEMAEPGKEGLCTGLLGTIYNASTPFGTAISNQIFALFQPNLYDVANYVADTPAFRETVAWSYAVTYATTLAGFVLIRLIPSQKEEAQHRKKEWGSHPFYGIMVLVLPTICFLYAITVLVMANIPELACLKAIGGPGCE
ncbi:Prostaglandin E synthase 2 [Durusdinium trenchii]|uniref:Prostaglandin E synthase 2 n=1 Tax=Durusdinium trenchii TaxID=1381693 RepID=A0ABP0ILF2_9DINO